MLPAPLLRSLRRALLQYARRLDGEALHAKAEKKALRTAAWAARQSAAYRTLIREHGLDPDRLNALDRLDALPVLTKACTFERFALNDLMRPVPPQDLADVLTSSGRSGQRFGFRLSTRKQHEGAWFDIDLGLQDIFQIDERPTLVVNCLPMGVTFSSRATAVANLSVREDMACSILRDVGPRFNQSVICTDPLFIRPLLWEAERRDVNWGAIRASVVIGEEVLVEPQRQFIEHAIGIRRDDPTEHRLVGSSFGIGELGLNLLFETRETIAMRRRAYAKQAASPTATQQTRGTPSLFCMNPLRCHVGVLDPDEQGVGELCFTLLARDAVIPLPRFASGDLGRILPREEMQAMAAEAGVEAPWMPMVSVLGRMKDQPDRWPSAERLKEVVYSNGPLANQLTGAFQLLRPSTATGGDLVGDGTAVLVVQARPGLEEPREGLAQRLQEHVSQQVALPLRVDLRSHHQVPWRPLMDYERKFTYLPGD